MTDSEEMIKKLANDYVLKTTSTGFNMTDRSYEDGILFLEPTIRILIATAKVEVAKSIFDELKDKSDNYWTEGLWTKLNIKTSVLEQLRQKYLGTSSRLDEVKGE